MTAPSETQKLCTHNVPLSEQCDKCNAGGNGRYGIHIAPSETPLTDAAIVSAEFIRREMDYYSHKFVLADVARSLEIALAESRAECERLRKEADKERNRADAWVKAARELSRSLGLSDDESDGSIRDWAHICSVLNMRAEKIAAAETREREAYERVEKALEDEAMLCDSDMEYDNNLENQDKQGTAFNRGVRACIRVVRTLGERREGRTVTMQLQSCATFPSSKRLQRGVMCTLHPLIVTVSSLAGAQRRKFY